MGFFAHRINKMQFIWKGLILLYFQLQKKDEEEMRVHLPSGNGFFLVFKRSMAMERVHFKVYI